MHLTAHKLLSYKYVTAQEMEKVNSMAIVRNPYSRMVSIYSYNRFFGEFESFAHFLDDWYKNVTKAYREKGELEEWYTPCHAIPQFEYTHWQGQQLVHSIVKQEELKDLKHPPDQLPPESSVAGLPEIVRDALLGMPHSNQRRIAKKWYDYYDQRTLDMVYEMYQKDFEVFGYCPVLKQRPDLQPPANATQHANCNGLECGLIQQARSDAKRLVPHGDGAENNESDMQKATTSASVSSRSLKQLVAVAASEAAPNDVEEGTAPMSGTASSASSTNDF
jgi:hypothetical protein